MHIYRGSHKNFSCTQFFFRYLLAKLSNCQQIVTFLLPLAPPPASPSPPPVSAACEDKIRREDLFGELQCECRLNYAISNCYGGSHPCTPVPALPWRFEAAVCRQVPFEAAIVGGGGGENERVADFGEGEKGAENLADIVAVQRGAIEHFGSAT